MGADLRPTSCRKLVNFGSLTRELAVMDWRSFMRQMRERRKIVETRSILETRIRQWMSGTAERICAKLTWKMCLVLGSDVFKCQCQMSKVKVIRDKKRAVHSQHLRDVDGMERPRCR